MRSLPIYMLIGHVRRQPFRAGNNDNVLHSLSSVDGRRSHSIEYSCVPILALTKKKGADSSLGDMMFAYTGSILFYVYQGRFCGMFVYINASIYMVGPS